MNWKRINRKIHYWGALVVALPVLIVIVTGILLLLKKDIDWLQPPTAAGQGKVPTLSVARILEVSKSVPEAAIAGWADIDRVDLRPRKGVLKVRARNSWEIQIDHQTGEVLQVAYRRSDLIEALHDGSFFHSAAKLWVFLPASLVLLALWVTGVYLFLVPLLARRKARQRRGRPDPEKIPETMATGGMANRAAKSAHSGRR